MTNPKINLSELKEKALAATPCSCSMYRPEKWEILALIEDLETAKAALKEVLEFCDRTACKGAGKACLVYEHHQAREGLEGMKTK